MQFNSTLRSEARHEPDVAFKIGDYLLAMLTALAALGLCLHGFSEFSPQIYDERRGFDVWFGADQPRIIMSMTDRGSLYHQRASVHPIFSLMMFPTVRLLMMFGLSVIQAGQVVVAACGMLCAALLFLSMRGLGLPRLAAFAFTAVFLSSAAYLHWFSVVETYAPAALSICLVLFALTCVGPGHRLAWCLVSVGALAVTVTNWMIALASMAFRLGLRRALQTAAASLLIVAVLAGGQKLIFPKAALFFLPGSVSAEYKFTSLSSWYENRLPWSPGRNLWSALTTTAIAPAPRLAFLTAEPNARQFVTYQEASPRTLPVAGLVGLLSWGMMLAIGLHGALSRRRLAPVALPVAVFLSVQFAMHSVYGTETFLYSAHFIPALVLLCAFSWFSPLRVAALAAAALFVVVGGGWNLAQLHSGAQLANWSVAQPLAAAERHVLRAAARPEPAPSS